MLGLEKEQKLILTVKNCKWRWAGHVCRQETERRTRRTTEWRPWYGGRGRGRPKMRWRDEIDRELGKVSWRRVAEDRSWWKQGEGLRTAVGDKWLIKKKKKRGIYRTSTSVFWR